MSDRCADDGNWLARLLAGQEAPKSAQEENHKPDDPDDAVIQLEPAKDDTAPTSPKADASERGDGGVEDAGTTHAATLLTPLRRFMLRLCLAVIRYSQVRKLLSPLDRQSPAMTLTGPS